MEVFKAKQHRFSEMIVNYKTTTSSAVEEERPGFL